MPENTQERSETVVEGTAEGSATADITQERSETVDANAERLAEQPNDQGEPEQVEPEPAGKVEGKGIGLPEKEENPNTDTTPAGE